MEKPKQRLLATLLVSFFLMIAAWGIVRVHVLAVQLKEILSAAEIPSAVIEKTVNQVTMTGLGLTLLFLGLFTLIAFLLLRRFVNSLYQLIHAVKEASLGHPDRRIKVSGQHEIELLAKAFDQMNVQLKTMRDQLENNPVEGIKKYKEKEVFSKKIIETAYDAFIAIDQNSVITQWNKQAEKTFGWSAKEAIGKLLFETIVPSQYHEAHKKGIAHFLKTGEGPVLQKRIELNAKHKDGHQFPVELTVWPLKIDQDYTFNAFIHDITARKQAEEKLKQHAEELERFNQASIEREKRMIELKQEVNQLSTELGKKKPYDLLFKEKEP